MRRSPLYSYCIHFKSHVRPNWRCRQCVVMPWTRSDHYHSCGSMLWLRSDDHRLRIPTLRIFWSCAGVTEVRAKRAPLLTLANVARRVSALLGEDAPGAVCKFTQSALLLLLVARPLAELEKKITMACVQSRPQAAETAE